MGTVPTLKGTSLHSLFVFGGGGVGGGDDDLFVSIFVILVMIRFLIFFFFFFFFFFNLPVSFTNAAAREDAAQ